jgi:arsenite/tail-anchored protein-transporting ATPase
MLAERLRTARWTFVVGKGGVGKTTTAAALALEASAAGSHPTVVSLDPAHSLRDALGEGSGLRVLELDARGIAQGFLTRHREVLLGLVEGGTYLSRDEAAGLLDLSLPGAEELGAVLYLMEAAASEAPLIVDTPPMTPTLRMLRLVEGMSGWIDALAAMAEKRRAVADAFAGGGAPDPAAPLLRELREGRARLGARLRDPAWTRFVLVATPEEDVLAQTRWLRGALEGMGMVCAGMVLNRAPEEGPPALSADPSVVRVPELPALPAGAAGVRRFAGLDRADPAPAEGARTAHLRVGPAWSAEPLPELLWVVGKGGVGKSTVAAALAVAAADRGPVRLLTLEPDAVPDRGPAGADLRLQHLDPAGSWQRFREAYRAEVEHLFAALSGATSAELDRRVVHGMLDLAPPGMDELLALLATIDPVGEAPYNPRIVDGAATGHLLRLLELPDLVLGWVHAILRLLLRHRAATGLGSLAERLLAIARDLRRLSGLLRDPGRCGFLVVARAEALVVPETERMLDRLRSAGFPIHGVLLNRFLVGEAPAAEGLVEPAARLVRHASPSPVAAAPERPGVSRDPGSLAGFVHEWRALSTAE